MTTTQNLQVKEEWAYLCPFNAWPEVEVDYLLVEVGVKVVVVGVVFV